MVKTVLIFLLISCFVLEDAAAMLPFYKQTFVCFADPVKEDNSDKKEKDGEEKVDESKIQCEFKYLLASISTQDKNYLHGSKFYPQHITEIHTPPPDFI